MMNPEIKELWIAALLSGDYTQTKSMLRSNAGGYCCLGVLCDVNRKATRKGYWRETDGEANRNGELADFLYEVIADNSILNGLTLPVAIMVWAGLKDDNPRVKQPTSVFSQSLSELNDNGISFEAIAEVIRRKL